LTGDPVDSDDVMFLLCAMNGRATHLASYDRHLLSLRPYYAGQVTKRLNFSRVPESKFGRSLNKRE